MKHEVPRQTYTSRYSSGKDVRCKLRSRVRRARSVVRDLQIWVRRDYGPPGSQKLHTFHGIPVSSSRKIPRAAAVEKKACAQGKRRVCQTSDCVLLITGAIISHANETNVVILYITFILIFRIYCQHPLGFKGNARALYYIHVRIGCVSVSRIILVSYLA